MIGDLGVTGRESDVLRILVVSSEAGSISAVDFPLSCTRCLNASMNVRPLDVPAKYESDPSSSKR